MRTLRILAAIILVAVVGHPVENDAQTLTTLWQFGGSTSNGFQPHAGLVQGGDGYFYGTLYSGAQGNGHGHGNGSVFQISAAGTFAQLYEFPATIPETNGASPNSVLVQGSDGNFYGTTAPELTPATVFRITSQGTLSTLYAFSGIEPEGGLVQGNDGNFYGTTTDGGTNNDGTVFRISSAGTLTTLHQLGTVATAGIDPVAGLVQGADGNFYGTTFAGGTNDDGTVFRISSAGTLSILYQFGTVASEGIQPDAGLVQGSDGNFYGTTYDGGTNNFGTVFKITPQGTLATLHQFGALPTDGVYPQAGLVQGSDGNFYGTTVYGGTYGSGTVFQITSAGSLTTLYQFGGVATDGTVPLATLVQGSDGYFYGTTELGGTNNDGTVFRIIPPYQIDAWASSSGGKWEIGSNNWSLGVAPSINDSVDQIANASSKTVTIDPTTVLSNTINGCLTISNLIVSGPLGSTNTLLLNNAGTGTPLAVLDSVSIDSGGSILITNSAMQVIGPSGGALTVNGGALTMESGTMLVSSNFSVGPLNGVSIVTIAGGTLFVTNSTGTGQLSLYNGSFALSNDATVVADTYTNIGGTFTNLGGTFVVNSQATVNQGTNTFSGGTSQIGSNLTVASAASSTGAVAVTGGSLIATNATTTIGGGSNSVASIVVSSNATMLTRLTSLGVGSNSTASLTLQGTATMQVLSNLTAGSGVGSTASVYIAGGQLTATNGVIGIGNDGSTTNGFGYAQMTVSNSSVLANQILLGSIAGGHGDLTIQPNGVVSLVGSNALLVPDGVTIDGGELDIDNGEIVCGSGTNFPGSLTMNNGTATLSEIDVGSSGNGTLTISGGLMTVLDILDLGSLSGSAGSVWMSGGTLTAGVIEIGVSGVGQLSLSNNGIIQVSFSLSVGASGAAGAAGTLTVAGGSLTSSVPVYVGAGSVWVSGGQLQAPSLLIGYNNYGVGDLTISNGSVQANSLILTNLANSQFALVGGSLSSGGTVVTNTHLFVVGNSINAATFAMAGGTHWFANGLEVANNATLTGCGTIDGTVTIDAGAHAVATCGTVTFGNTATINGNGVVRALNGSVLNFSSPLVNNGAIDVLNGSATFSSPPTGTGSILTTNCLPVITSIQQVGADIHVSFTTGTNAPYAVNYETDMVAGTWTTLTNLTGTGGIMTIVDSAATLQPKRFYQVNLVVPP